MSRKPSKDSPYSVGREPKKAGQGYYQEGVKFSRDNRLDASGNYKEKPRSIGADVNNVSGMGLSRPVRQAGIKRYGP